MISKLSPHKIVAAHWSSFRDDSTGKLSFAEIGAHLLIPAFVAAIYRALGDGITENAVAIIISAASIAAGLLLNLLVLIYTLVYNAKSAPEPIKNLDAFRQVCDEALATIAYCILTSLGLVLSAFFCMTSQSSTTFAIAQFITLYLGTTTILCILIILKRIYALVHFEVTR